MHCSGTGKTEVLDEQRDMTIDSRREKYYSGLIWVERFSAESGFHSLLRVPLKSGIEAP